MQTQIVNSYEYCALNIRRFNLGPEYYDCVPTENSLRAKGFSENPAEVSAKWS
jgi:hypothetical protein